MCVCSLLGHSQLGMAVRGKLLCCGYVFLGSHKLGKFFKPDALGGFGWCVSTSAQHCMLAMTCLPACPGFCFCLYHQNVAAALGWEQQLLKRVTQTGWLRWQSRLCSSQLVKHWLESPGSASLFMCDITSVTPWPTCLLKAAQTASSSHCNICNIQGVSIHLPAWIVPKKLLNQPGCSLMKLQGKY